MGGQERLNVLLLILRWPLFADYISGNQRQSAAVDITKQPSAIALNFNVLFIAQGTTLPTCKRCSGQSLRMRLRCVQLSLMLLIVAVVAADAEHRRLQALRHQSPNLHAVITCHTPQVACHS